MHLRFVAPFAIAFVVLLPPAAEGAYEISGKPDGGTMIVKQTADDGTVTIRVTPTSYLVDDGTGFTTTSQVPTGLKITMLPSSGLDIDLDGPLAKNADILLLGSGQVSLTGDDNSIGGNLKIRAKEGIQQVALAMNSGLDVGKNLLIDLGEGHDVLHDDGNFVHVMGSAKITGVNLFEVEGTFMVEKNLAWNVAKEDQATTLDDNERLSVAGSFKFVGGPARDRVYLDGDLIGSYLGKNVKIDLKGSPVEQEVRLGPGCELLGNVNLKGRGLDGTRLTSDPAVLFGKNLSASFTGPGTNVVSFIGTLNGKSAKYKGGDGLDDVRIDLAAPQAKVSVKLGDDDDILGVYKPLTDIKLLTVNGGKGDGDGIINGFTPDPFPFPFKLKNVEAGP